MRASEEILWKKYSLKTKATKHYLKCFVTNVQNGGGCGGENDVGVRRPRATNGAAPKKGGATEVAKDLERGGKPVDKPGSVAGNHSSRRTVASTLKQPTRKRREPRLMLPYLALLRMGFAVPSVLPRPR